jgi:hypothetical protein
VLQAFYHLIDPQASCDRGWLPPSPDEEVCVMDINYLLKREQVSLLMAKLATGREARFAHAGLARGYGALLAESTYPHREPDVPNAARAYDAPDRLVAAA